MPGKYWGHHQFKGPRDYLRWKRNFENIRFEIFLRKEARLSQDCNVAGSSFQVSGAATEKAPNVAET